MNGAASLDAGALLPSTDHALRYIPRKYVDPKSHEISGKGFLPRAAEGQASINWLEFFASPLNNQIAEVRRHRRLTYEKRGKLVRMNVGQTTAHLATEAPILAGINMTYDPLDAEPPKHPLADQSHSLFHGLPDTDSDDAAVIGELLLDCIVGLPVSAIP